MNKMNTDGHKMDIDGYEVEYGRIPKDLVPDWATLIFYFETRGAKEKHDELVDKAITRLCQENEDYGVTWEIEEKEKVTDNRYYQLTVIGLSIHDSY